MSSRTGCPPPASSTAASGRSARGGPRSVPPPTPFLRLQPRLALNRSRRMLSMRREVIGSARRALHKTHSVEGCRFGCHALGADCIINYPQCRLLLAAAAALRRTAPLLVLGGGADHLFFLACDVPRSALLAIVVVHPLQLLAVRPAAHRGARFVPVPLGRIASCRRPLIRSIGAVQ